MLKAPSKKLSTWRAMTASLVLSLLQTACGGGGTTSVTRTPSAAGSSAAVPVITSFTPNTAPAGSATLFTVLGTDIPLTSVVSLPGGTCASPTNATDRGFSTVCTPGSPGLVTAIVNNNTPANGGNQIGQQTLTITDPVPVVVPTPATPVTALSLLTDTGITVNQCYGAGSDALISCTSAAAIALNAQQDGMVGRDVVNADSTDGLLGSSYSFLGTDCVKDNVTGLIWQRASTTLTSLPGDNQNQEANGDRNAANAASLCGFTDWRLPTPFELQSLLNYGSSNPLFAIDLNWFVSTRSNWYITGTQYRSGSSANVWVVDFVSGRVSGIGASGGQLELRLVR
jgi:hypothetical protein